MCTTNLLFIKHVYSTFIKMIDGNTIHKLILLISHTNVNVLQNWFKLKIKNRLIKDH